MKGVEKAILYIESHYREAVSLDEIASVRDTCAAIWADWLPGSGTKVVEAPWFEKYGDAFDPRTGIGGLEIWIPVHR